MVSNSFPSSSSGGGQSGVIYQSERIRIDFPEQKKIDIPSEYMSEDYCLLFEVYPYPTLGGTQCGCIASCAKIPIISTRNSSYTMYSIVNYSTGINQLSLLTLVFYGQQKYFTVSINNSAQFASPVFFTYSIDNA